MATNLLPQGFSFTDPDLFSKSAVERANLVFDPQMKERERIDLLVSAISNNRLDVIEQVVGSLNPKKLAGPQLIMKVVKAAAENLEVNEEVLNFLDKSQLLNRHNFIISLDESRNYQAMCWLLRDRENIELTERNLPDSYVRIGKNDEKVRSAAGMLPKIAGLGLAGKLSTLDIGYILRNEKPKHSHEGASIFSAAIRSAKASTEDLVKLSEVIWDLKTYRLMYENRPPEEMRFDLLRGAKNLVSFVIFDETDELEQATQIEKIVSRSPSLATVLDQYWQLPQEVLLANHPGKWGLLDTTIISQNLPGIRPPQDRDLLDCAIRCGSDWVQRAVLEKGMLEEEIWRRLRQDNGPLMAGFIRGLAPSESHNYVPVLIAKIGSQWKDPQGRGLGHYLLKSANSLTAELVKAIAKSKEGVGLLGQMDPDGKAAISFLENNEDWKPQYKRDLLDKIKHKILENIAQSQPIERKTTPRPHF